MTIEVVILITGLLVLYLVGGMCIRVRDLLNQVSIEKRQIKGIMNKSKQARVTLILITQKTNLFATGF